MKKGFTLIELSIVLIIISLVVAAVTGGKALIRQAEIQSITNEITTFKLALGTFKLKYNTIPGDMEEAWDYWGDPADPGNPGGVGNCSDNSVLSVPTGCNGNGNGRISGWNKESLRAWQHLSLSGIVSGNYTGEPTGAGNQEAGTNIAASKLNGGGYQFYGKGTGVPPLGDYPGMNHAQNIIRFGKYCDPVLFPGPCSNGVYQSGLLPPPDTKSLDQKIDDGKAITGFILAEDGANSIIPCLPAGPLPKDYSLENTDGACLINIVLERESK